MSGKTKLFISIFNSAFFVCLKQLSIDDLIYNNEIKIGKMDNEVSIMETVYEILILLWW